MRRKLRMSWFFDIIYKFSKICECFYWYISQIYRVEIICWNLVCFSSSIAKNFEFLTFTTFNFSKNADYFSDNSKTVDNIGPDYKTNFFNAKMV